MLSLERQFAVAVSEVILKDITTMIGAFHKKHKNTHIDELVKVICRNSVGIVNAVSLDLNKGKI